MLADEARAHLTEDNVFCMSAIDVSIHSPLKQMLEVLIARANGNDQQARLDGAAAIVASPKNHERDEEERKKLLGDQVRSSAASSELEGGLAGAQSELLGKKAEGVGAAALGARDEDEDGDSETEAEAETERVENEMGVEMPELVEDREAAVVGAQA
eukprot:GABV01003087.1.p2 GENE.GABV01003087.1~~GABV01003087.1.p2  ORF type:complete len:183 (-),score=54.24 GABV01003087.1:56-526(-)